MKKIMIALLGLVVVLGCARVSVQAPKDPIKVDISMRLDIYVSQAYAAEDLSSEVQAAALRRKDRRDQLISLAEKGIIGENKSGLLVIRLSDKADASATKLVNEENRDRMIIYQSVAQKNGSSVEEVQKLYAKRLQQDALVGTPIEVFDNARGSFEWTIKK